jgi:glycosyltransferase involved in cell wall biosynthesis
MLIFEARETNMHMRRALNPAVSVYESSWVVEYGADRFLADAGISLVHSHTVGAELHFFHMWRITQDVRFLATLHGSYEASDLPHDVVETITSSVDHFVYTADKNLLPLEPFDVPPARVTKMPNAMPVDPEPFPKTRAELGIADDAVVFTLVARGIKRKGWRAAIHAFVRIRDRHPEHPMHLCLVGEGEVPDQLKKKHGSDPDISFLGYQSRINGLYRMTDVAVVPTRFSGESYPLCIIQALQVGTPVIGTDVGEISSMLVRDGTEGGLVIEAVRDTEQLIANLAAAMEKMLDPHLRKRLAQGAEALGHDYDMETLVEAYGGIYRRLLGIEAGEIAELQEAQKPMRRSSRR